MTYFRDRLEAIANVLKNVLSNSECGGGARHDKYRALCADYDPRKEQIKTKKGRGILSEVIRTPDMDRAGSAFDSVQ
jgi:hypothetical protein